MKTLKQLEEKSWEVAIGHYLSDFPQDKTPEEIIELIKEDDDDIIFWFPFEGFDPEWVAEHIETMQYLVFEDLKWAVEVE